MHRMLLHSPNCGSLGTLCLLLTTRYSFSPLGGPIFSGIEPDLAEVKQKIDVYGNMAQRAEVTPKMTTKFRHIWSIPCQFHPNLVGVGPQFIESGLGSKLAESEPKCWSMPGQIKRCWSNMSNLGMLGPKSKKKTSRQTLVKFDKIWAQNGRTEKFLATCSRRAPQSTQSCRTVA